jgi:hypothetical protein
VVKKAVQSLKVKKSSHTLSFGTNNSIKFKLGSSCVYTSCKGFIKNFSIGSGNLGEMKPEVSLKSEILGFDETLLRHLTTLQELHLWKPEGEKYLRSTQKFIETHEPRPVSK